MIVMSVTPTVCMTLAFWLGRGRRSGAVCADPYSAVPSTNNKSAKQQVYKCLREFMEFLLVLDFAGIIHPAGLDRKQSSPNLATVFLRTHHCIAGLALKGCGKLSHI